MKKNLGHEDIFETIMTKPQREIIHSVPSCLSGSKKMKS